jgi:hypothetical protein
MDDFIASLRARAADPERRTDVRPSVFDNALRTLDFGSLLTMGRSIGADLSRVVAANQAGEVDQRGSARAQAIGQAMATPVLRELPAPASEANVQAAEAALGVRLPFDLRRVEQMRDYQLKAAREARASIGRLTSEQRAAMGLPEVGWERVVCGGIGLDEDTPPGR